LQDLEDSIKLNIRNRLRSLHELRESLQIAAQQVELNKRVFTPPILTLQAGRAIIRDVLDAQRYLLSSQNSQTSSMVNYRMAEMNYNAISMCWRYDPDVYGRKFLPRS
jgi:outer membrane protein TolC